MAKNQENSGPTNILIVLNEVMMRIHLHGRFYGNLTAPQISFRLQRSPSVLSVLLVLSRLDGPGATADARDVNGNFAPHLNHTVENQGLINR